MKQYCYWKGELWGGGGGGGGGGGMTEITEASIRMIFLL